jgi:hypothetical protein
MNQDKFLQFGEAYRKGLRSAVEADMKKPADKQEYSGVPLDQTDVVVERMLRAITLKPLGVNYNGDGFRRTCKLLGIKPTRKAIFEFLEIKAS